MKPLTNSLYNATNKYRQQSDNPKLWHNENWKPVTFYNNSRINNNISLPPHLSPIHNYLSYHLCVLFIFAAIPSIFLSIQNHCHTFSHTSSWLSSLNIIFLAANCTGDNWLTLAVLPHAPTNSVTDKKPSSQQSWILYGPQWSVILRRNENCSSPAIKWCQILRGTSIRRVMYQKVVYEVWYKPNR